MAQIRLADGYFVDDLLRHAVVPAGGLSGTISWDLKGLEATAVTSVVVTGTLGTGLTLGPIVNMLDTSVVKIYLPDPGAETWAIDAGYKWLSNVPVHEAGKIAFYQITQVEGVQYIAGQIEGGTPIGGTGESNLDLPTAASGGGIEQQWTNAGAVPSFVRGYTGNLSTGPGSASITTTMGGPASGQADHIIQFWGGVKPDSTRSLPVPYTHPDSTQFGLGIFLDNTSQFTITQGTAWQAGAEPYEIWFRYTKK